MTFHFWFFHIFFFFYSHRHFSYWGRARTTYYITITKERVKQKNQDKTHFTLANISKQFQQDPFELRFVGHSVTKLLTSIALVCSKMKYFLVKLKIAQNFVYFSSRYCNWQWMKQEGTTHAGCRWFEMHSLCAKCCRKNCRFNWHLKHNC